jgi:hypothetical protein
MARLSMTIADPAMSGVPVVAGEGLQAAALPPRASPVTGKSDT